MSIATPAPSVSPKPPVRTLSSTLRASVNPSELKVLSFIAVPEFASIAAFNSATDPVVVVSQKISSKEVTGAVSATARLIPSVNPQATDVPNSLGVDILAINGFESEL